MKLVVASVLVIAAPAFADKAKDAAAWCADHGGDTLVFEKTGHVSRDGETYPIRWRGRLDADRRQDVIVDEGGCGTRECMLVGYVGCTDGTYAKVFTQYAARVRVKPQKRGWALLLLEHVGDAKPRGERDRSWDTTRFGENGYD